MECWNDGKMEAESGSQKEYGLLPIAECLYETSTKGTIIASFPGMTGESRKSRQC